MGKLQELFDSRTAAIEAGRSEGLNIFLGPYPTSGDWNKNNQLVVGYKSIVSEWVALSSKAYKLSMIRVGGRWPQGHMKWQWQALEPLA
jgi:hypothetical protein